MFVGFFFLKQKCRHWLAGKTLWITSEVGRLLHYLDLSGFLNTFHLIYHRITMAGKDL